MGATKRTFADQREIENLTSRIKHERGYKFQQEWDSVKLVNLLEPRHIGDFKCFRLLIQCNLTPEDALKLTHGPQSKECRELLLAPATEPKHEFGDYWDEWMNSPERFDEERENNLLWER